MRIESDQIKTFVALSVMIVLFVVGVIIPGRAQFDRIADRMEASRAMKAEASNLNQELNRRRAVVSQLDAKIEKAVKIVPARMDEGLLAEQFNKALVDRGAQDVRVTHEAEKRGAKYNVVPITLGFNGQFLDVYLLMEQIQSMSRVIRIDRVDIQNDIDKPEEPLVIEMRLSAYSKVQEANP